MPAIRRCTGSGGSVNSKSRICWPLICGTFTPVVMGFTFLATVPPTVGLVVKLHGMRFMATLFGIVMLSHQVGGFLGAWLGGVLFERTGSYDWMWYLDIMLALGAALIHLPIKEAPKRTAAAAA